MCMCVCLERDELSMFALHCGELSIVTGAESGLRLPHLKGGDEFGKLEGRKEEEEERGNQEELMRLLPHCNPRGWLQIQRKFLGNLDCKSTSNKLQLSYSDTESLFL